MALWIMDYIYTDFNNIRSKKLANHKHSILQGITMIVQFQ